MPPKGSKGQKGSSSGAGRPEPMNLEGIFETLTTSGVAPQNRAYAIVALNSVVHHPTVKKILTNPKYQPVLRCLVLTLAQGDVYSYEARWETLATIGELCRVEHNPETRTSGVSNSSADVGADAASNAASLNKMAKYFYGYFGGLGFLKSILTDCINDKEGDPDVKIAAKDIIDAFSVTAEVQKAPPAAGSPGEEDEVSGSDDALATKWTKETKALCKNLLYLDASEKYHLVPLVAKGSPSACASCNNPISTVAADGKATQALRCGQCKAVFYCSQACQVAHWKAGHKVPCTTQKENLEKYLAAGGAKAKGPAVRFPLEPTLYYSTRRYMFECRPEFMKDVPYQKLFMEFNCPDLL